MLLVPAVPEHLTTSGLPDAEILRGINYLLEEQSLAVDERGECRLLPSKSFESMPDSRIAKASGRPATPGFWACPLRYPVVSSKPKIQQSRFDAVFEKVEALCPRFFRPGEAATRVIRDGEMRDYSEADMKVYVTQDGAVYYRYKRSISAVRIGTVAEVMNGTAAVDCSRIRGRSGLPWEREL